MLWEIRETGDRHGEGQAWNNLGNALRKVRRFDEAITAHERARDIFREFGDLHSEGLAWGNLGLTLAETRRFDEAITVYKHEIAICAELGDRYQHARILGRVGMVHTELDDPQQARRAWTDAAQLFTAAGAADDADLVRRMLAALDTGTW